MENQKRYLGVGLLTAIAASMCCIAPVLALLAGTSSLAINFEWIEPFRPYLIAISVLFLGFAWFQKLKKKKKLDDCNCEVEEKKSFFESTLFFILLTIFSILSIAFPYFSEYFY